MKKYDSLIPCEGALCDLLAFDATGRAIWPAEELRASLSRRLAMPPLRELVDGEAQIALRDVADSIHSFADLFTHPRPPVELLRWAKDYSKLQHDSPQSSFPPEISLIIYYGSIIAAMLFWNEKISRLGEDDLHAGLNWALAEPWMDERMLRLFRAGVTFLRSSRRLWRR